MSPLNVPRRRAGSRDWLEFQTHSMNRSHPLTNGRCFDSYHFAFKTATIRQIHDHTFFDKKKPCGTHTNHWIAFYQEHITAFPPAQNLRLRIIRPCRHATQKDIANFCRRKKAYTYRHIMFCWIVISKWANDLQKLEHTASNLANEWSLKKWSNTYNFDRNFVKHTDK